MDYIEKIMNRRNQIEIEFHDKDALILQSAHRTTNQAKIDLSDLERYSGTYNAKGFLPLRFSVIEGTLQIAFRGTQLRTFAVDENRFELENTKGFSYTFVEAEDFDLIAIRGQVSRYYSKVEP